MNEVEISRIAAAISDLRPDWPAASIRSLLNRPEMKNRPRRDVAVALAWVACEADSKTPARVIEAGPWWQAAIAESSAATLTHTGKTVGLNADPREVCGICDMWRADCDGRAATSGHTFVSRSECLPPRTPGVLEQSPPCLAGPITSPCRLGSGHEGPHDCPPSPVAEPVAHLRALRNEAIAELCSHGVARTNCTTHREPKPPADHGHTPTEHTEQGDAS